MKKLLLSMVAMLFAIGVNATVVETNADSGFTGDENGYTATISGYKISYLKHENNNGCVAPSADHIRVYKNGMLVIEAVDGSPITSLEITTTGGNYCSNIVVTGADEAVANSPLITWTGNVTKFEGVTSNSQVRIKSIKINEGVTEPEVFTPAGTGEGTVESPYNVERALSIINNGKYNNTAVYVKGKISKIESVDTDQYGNATYFISDNGTENDELEIYRGYSLGGQKFASADEIKVGDEVVVCGKLTLYGTTPEVTTGSSIYSINGNTYTEPDTPPYDLVGDGTKANPYIVSDIQYLKKEESDGNKYWVKGVILGCAASATSLAADDKIGDTNIALGLTADATTFVPVAIPVGDIRTVLGVATNPNNVGKEVMVYGTLEKYFSVAGVKNVTECVVDGQEYSTGINAATVDASKAGVMFNLAGQQVNAQYKGVVVVNGKKVVRK